MSITSQNYAKISHILGIDFGLSKIGLALADSETKIASAYKTIENDKNFLHNLKEIAEKEGVDAIILGKAGKIGETRKKTRLVQKEFDIKTVGGEIKSNLGVEVFYQDEMFTTRMAEANLKEKGMKKIKRFDNAEAARIILQSWLDRKF